MKRAWEEFATIERQVTELRVALALGDRQRAARAAKRIEMALLLLRDDSTWEAAQ